MRRKVVLHGPSTLIISLPSKWARKYGVKRGDEIDVEEKGSKLLINAKGGVKLNKKELDISDLHPLINRTMMKIYQEGYDEIDVKFDNPVYLKNIQEVLPQLIGYEIIKQDRSSCTIKDIVKSSSEDFNVLFKKIFFLMKDIFKDGENALKEEDISSMKNIIYRDLELNKVTNYCLRVLNKEGVADDNKISVYFAIIHTCEKVGDLYKNMLQTFIDGNIKKDKKFLYFHEKMRLFFDEISFFTFKKSKTSALAISHQYDALKKEISSALFSSSLKTNILAFYLRNILDNIIFIQELQLEKI